MGEYLKIDTIKTATFTTKPKEVCSSDWQKQIERKENNPTNCKTTKETYEKYKKDLANVNGNTILGDSGGLKAYIMEIAGIDENLYNKFLKGHTLYEAIGETVPGTAKINDDVPKPSDTELAKYNAAYNKLMSIYLAHCAHETKDRLQNKGNQAIDISIDTLAIYDPEIRQVAEDAMAIISSIEAKYPGYMRCHIDENFNRIAFVRLPFSTVA